MSTAIRFPRQHYYLSGLIVLLACVLLFSLDRETTGAMDFFKTGNLIAMVLYFFPTYLICLLLNGLFYRFDNKYSLVLSLAIGIPMGLLIVIVTLAFMMGRV